MFKSLYIYKIRDIKLNGFSIDTLILIIISKFFLFFILTVKLYSSSKKVGKRQTKHPSHQPEMKKERAQQQPKSHSNNSPSDKARTWKAQTRSPQK